MWISNENRAKAKTNWIRIGIDAMAMAKVNMDRQ